MSRTFGDNLIIRRPDAAERRAALDLALAALAPELRQAWIAASHENRHGAESEVFGAWRGKQLVGALWAQIQPGRAGFLQAPRLREGERQGTGLELLAACEEWLAQRETRFYQLQLDQFSPQDAAILTAAEVEYAGDLLYLSSDLSGAEAPTGEVEFQPYRESQRDQIAKLVATTYENSLDLPMLDDVRSPSEVLEGYRSNGAHRSGSWQFVRRRGEDIGCLLLTEHDQQQWELVYMGIIPQARGEGLGRIIAAYAQHLVLAFGGRNLLLAVDAANAPALVAYRRTGFQPWRRTSVFLKVLRPAVEE